MRSNRTTATAFVISTLLLIGYSTPSLAESKKCDVNVSFTLNFKFAMARLDDNMKHQISTSVKDRPASSMLWKYGSDNYDAEPLIVSKFDNRWKLEVYTETLSGHNFVLNKRVAETKDWIDPNSQDSIKLIGTIHVSPDDRGDCPTLAIIAAERSSGTLMDAEARTEIGPLSTSGNTTNGPLVVTDKRIAGFVFGHPGLNGYTLVAPTHRDLNKGPHTLLIDPATVEGF